jgi:hypothetical protein
MTDSQAVPAPDVEPAGLREVADGVWVIPDRRVPLVPNIGLIEGEDKVLIVDVGMGPENGARVLTAAAEKAAGRSLLVTTTHFHPEHGFGFRRSAGKRTRSTTGRSSTNCTTKARATSRCFERSGRQSRRRSTTLSSSIRTRPTTADRTSSTSATEACSF